MKKLNLLLLAVLCSLFTYGQGPEVTTWIVNTTGQTGYNSIPANVQTVQYSTDSVYVSCSCIPGYSIGPWTGNPNIPVNKNFVFKINRFPQRNTGTAVAVGLGHVGVWSNGVSVFNADDGQTYNNGGVWHRNALVFEGISFDACLGHPAPGGEYHHHVNPRCLYDPTDSTHHSPIIGYAFDGFPIYGAYGYTDTTGTGPIKRMSSSYQLRNITDRTTLPDGTVLTASQYGPAINSTYPLGSFIQDYEYVAGSGDLDVHNGRFCVTPEYPSGTYAYFVTIDNTLYPIYPFVIGPTYYGTVQAGNTGPGGGHNAINEPTTVYNPTTGVEELNNRQILFELEPNPVKDYAFIYFDPNSINNITGSLYDSKGRLVETFSNWQPSISYTLDMTKYAAGTYILHMDSEKQHLTSKILKIK
jgi:hypothetical protein